MSENTKMTTTSTTTPAPSNVIRQDTPIEQLFDAIADGADLKAAGFRVIGEDDTVFLPCVALNGFIEVRGAKLADATLKAYSKGEARNMRAMSDSQAKRTLSKLRAAGRVK